MKVIDLLNKIANGEEVPKKIVHHSLTGDMVWEFENNCQVEYGYKTINGIYEKINKIIDCLNSKGE